MNKQKECCGEPEAKEILKKIGQEFDENYYDNNEKDGMPDLRFKDGYYLEVTQTSHNVQYIKEYTSFSDPFGDEILEERIKEETDPDELNKLKKELKDWIKYNETIERYSKKDYSEKQQWIADYEYLCRMNGVDNNYDLSNSIIFNENRKGARDPIIQFSLDHISDRIRIKSQKHQGKKIDLFLYITSEEYSLLMKKEPYDSSRQQLRKTIINSNFRNIFICVWDIYTGSYEAIEPILQLIVKEKKVLYHKIN